jgi:aminodeoxyfutalosine deaminase
MAYLAERRPGVTSGPGSNVRTGALASLDAHPIRRLVDAGVLVSGSTDDPAMFGLPLVGELYELQRRFGFTDAEIRQIALNAVECCWLSDHGKVALWARIVADFGWGE